jgi:hypothetical protein
VLLLAVTTCAADALEFVQPSGSPYATTEPAFTPSPGGFLGGEAVGDFNGDGISDVAVVDETGLPVFSPGESVTILLGSRSGALTIAPGSPVALFSGGMFAPGGPIATGDFNGDGNLDLAVVDEQAATVSILLGNGNGEFKLAGPPIPYSGGSGGSIAVGDFNGDGRQDLAIATTELNVLLVNGSGGFTPAPGSPLPLNGYSASLVAGDFNGDHRTDLAVALYSEEVAVYLNSGEGRFQRAGGVAPATDGAPSDMVAGKFTGAGPLDLATVASSTNTVTVLLGDGAGGFQQAPGSPFLVAGGPGASSSSPGLPESIAVGDFNCDGEPDIAAANFNGSSDSVAILQGDGSGGFTNAAGSPFPADGNPRPIAVGDFNGDRRPDIAVVNSFLGRVTALENATIGGSCEPSIAVSSPTDGATYTQGQKVVASYTCDAPTGASVTSCAGPVASGVAIDTETPGVHTFTVNTTDSDGVSASQSVTYDVTAAQPVVPYLSGVSETARIWRLGDALPRTSSTGRRRRLPVGTTFSFGLNVPAEVTFTFSEQVGGREVGAKCVALPRGNGKRRHCTLSVIVGSLTFSAHAGMTEVPFEGRISKHTRLGPGRYTLLVTATAAGERATPRSLAFEIAR